MPIITSAYRWHPVEENQEQFPCIEGSGISLFPNVHDYFVKKINSDIKLNVLESECIIQNTKS